MNEVIAIVAKNQSSNPAAASKIESEAVKSAEEITGGMNLAKETSVSSRYDTLDLSREYVKYKMNGENSTLQDQTSQLNSTVLQLFSSSSGKKPIYSYQLFAYTESELLDLFNQGEISAEEYEAEIADRDLNMLIQRKKESSKK